MPVRRCRAPCAVVIVGVVWALAGPSAAHATLNADGSLQVQSDLSPLPAAVSGQPVFNRINGHVPWGLSTTAPSGTVATPDRSAINNAALGDQMVRVGVAWPTVQPATNQNPDPPINLGVVDATYAAYVSRDIRPLFDIIQTPYKWVALAYQVRGLCHQTQSYCWAPPTASNRVG